MENSFVSKFFRGNERNIQKNCFIWNSIAGGINAAEAVVLMMIITRTDGVEAAGILSIAFAVGNLLMTVGKFGVRNYQVTDTGKEYSFNGYLTLRIITTILMAVCSIGYVSINCIFADYTADKAIVILGICFIYVIESFEDVFLGYYQEEGRLDIASKVFILRWIAIMVVFFICAVSGHTLVLAVISSAVISFVLEIFLIISTKRLFDFLPVRIETSQLSKLIKQCFSLFAVAFLTYYVTNAPKYAIDRFLNADIQAYYGYISMPVFVVELLNCFLYQPQIVGLAENWNSGAYQVFKKKERRQFLIIFGLTIVCVFGAYLLGIPVLSALYGVGLMDYKSELIILMVAGGALAFVGYTSVLLTVMRKQQFLLYNMLIVTVLAVLGFGRIVQAGGMLGASIYYLILMVLLAFLNYCCTIAVELRQKKEIK